MTILALQLASPIIRAVDIGGADNPGSSQLKLAGRTKPAATVYSPESRCWRRRSSSGSTYFVRHSGQMPWVNCASECPSM